MIASAADVATGQAPVFVVETMRDYTAWFADKDPREDAVNFTDPSTKKPFRAGYAMKDAVFRTNHAYDPTINKWVTSHISEKSDTFVRYLLLKDGFTHYGNNAIGDMEHIILKNGCLIMTSLQILEAGILVRELEPLLKCLFLTL
jgi:hypothetical protein